MSKLTDKEITEGLALGEAWDVALEMYTGDSSLEATAAIGGAINRVRSHGSEFTIDGDITRYTAALRELQEYRKRERRTVEVCECPELVAITDADGVHIGCGRPPAERYEVFCVHCGAVDLTANCTEGRMGHSLQRRPVREEGVEAANE